MTRFFTLLLTCCFFVGLSAQKLYTVQIGTFLDVRKADFTEVAALGFVYGNQMDGNLTQVFLGNYSDLAKAETVANQLRVRGFKNAMVLQRPTDTAQPIVVIQLTTQTHGKKIEWEQLERAGNLYVENDDQLIKIMTGIYPDIPTAQQLLPTIKQLGYRDAFVKTVNGGRLIPITTFETGIKKPLIPIALDNAPPVATTQVPTTPPASASVPTYSGTRGGTVVTPSPATYSPAVSVNTSADIPAAAEMQGLPNIRNRMKRESAQKLQLVLKEKGYYDGQIDGYYGRGTASAYNAAWEDQEAVRKYRMLSADADLPSNDPLMTWPEIKVLATVAEDMGAGTGDVQLALQSVNTRRSLYNANQALSPAAATRANAWALTLWENLDAWAIEDPMHARVMNAFRIAYFQSEVRLEDYYMDRGLPSDAAKDLATATLQSLIGASLERFL